MDEVRPKVVSRSSLIEFPGHHTGKLVEPGGFPQLKRPELRIQGNQHSKSYQSKLGRERELWREGTAETQRAVSPSIQVSAAQRTLVKRLQQEPPGKRTTSKDHKEQCCAHAGPFALLSLIPLLLFLR